jgi:hypothetical protein
MQPYNLIRIFGGQDAVGRLLSLSPLLSCRPLPTLLFMARTSYRTHFWLGDVCLSLTASLLPGVRNIWKHSCHFLNVASHVPSFSIMFHHFWGFISNLTYFGMRTHGTRVLSDGYSLRFQSRCLVVNQCFLVQYLHLLICGFYW